MPEKPKNILIVNTFGIGDVLFSTPMIKALKTRFPDAHIDFMCNHRCRHLLRHNKNIGRIIEFEKDDFRNLFKKSKLDFAKKFLKLIKRIKNGHYDLAIDLSLGYQISLLLKLLAIKERLGFNYRNRGRFLTKKVEMNGFNEKHAAEYYLDIIRLLGIGEVKDKNLEIFLSEEFEKWADSFLEENKLQGKILIGIAPGGGNSWGKYAVYRRWAPENFSYVAGELSKKIKNLFFIIFGGREEKVLSKKIEKELPGNSVNLCGKLILPHSIALIKRCNLILCNDGGILHIAVSQGVNTVSIFGPVDENIYGPYPASDKHRVIKAEGVLCRPCYKRFKHTMCEAHDCLKMIDREKVLKLALDSLNLPAHQFTNRSLRSGSGWCGVSPHSET